MRSENLSQRRSGYNYLEPPIVSEKEAKQDVVARLKDLVEGEVLSLIRRQQARMDALEKQNHVLERQMDLLAREVARLGAERDG